MSTKITESRFRWIVEAVSSHEALGGQVGDLRTLVDINLLAPEPHMTLIFRTQQTISLMISMSRKE
jgi:hypothetical protein